MYAFLISMFISVFVSFILIITADWLSIKTVDESDDFLLQELPDEDNSKIKELQLESIGHRSEKDIDFLKNNQQSEPESENDAEAVQLDL